MNWYKEAQQNNWIITKLVSMFGTASVLTLISMYGLQGLNSQYQSNPQQVEQQAKQIQQEEPTQSIEQPQFSNRSTKNTVIEDPVIEQSQEVNINLDKIWEIESSRGTDPRMGMNNKKARGHYQFLKPTWDECVSKMGKDWNWWDGAMDYNKSTQVADFYLNKRIPEMLKYYDIPDSVDNRIGAYDWGIGKMLKVWKKYKENWKSKVPLETTEYIQKYNN
ncbi:MAG: hypothetical protein J7L15_04165 [Clostridiales bacterium]|nr:hypothetical protein [Clostridiales bacterium]